MWTVYRHRNGTHYLALGKGLHSETLEPVEVYRALYDNELSSLWVRPHHMFYGEVAPGEKRFLEVGRVRVVAPEDQATVLAFGYDAWGEGRSLEIFIESYAVNKNHLRGTRYLFELPTGEVVGNLNTLRFKRGLVGIASMSVAPSARRRGIASLLLRTVMELFRIEDSETRFMLYSEVGVELYLPLGFAPLPAALQFHPPAIAMATGALELSAEERGYLREYF